MRPSCSDNPATYGSPSIDLRVLLFVLGGRFALDGGGASAHSGYPLALRALWTCASSDFLSSAVVTYCCALLVRLGTTERLWATGHSVSLKNTKLLTRESNWHKKNEGGHIHQTESPYHEQRSGIPSPCHLQPNYPAEI